MEASLEQLELSLGSREHTNIIVKEKGSKLVIRGRGTGGRAYYNVYECKTCNKVFSKFQALGGHTILCQKKHSALKIAQDDGNNKKYKLHGCSICGSEYTTGQALGGHMTRHRAPVGIATSSKPRAFNFKPYKPRKKMNVLPLDFDLNLAAAPEDKQRKSKFAFGSKQQQEQTNKSCLLCTSLGAFSLL